MPLLEGSRKLPTKVSNKALASPGSPRSASVAERLSYLEGMKTTTIAPTSQETHPPLARDAQGNLLPIPEGTRAWRVSRQTKGRPRIVNGPDKQPARFPLDITVEELVDTCGADTYRIHALDEVGNVIDYVTTIETARELRNAAEADVALVPALRSTSTMSSDLRYALEAVTHIARTNAEAMRAVAESQAEWIKSISSARGFFRNAPPIQVTSPADGDDDEEDDGGPNTKAHWIDTLQPVIGIVMQQLVASVMNGKRSSGEGAGSSQWQLSDAFNGAQAARKHDEAALAQAPEGPNSPIDPVALQHALVSKALAVAQHLEPTERERLMRLAPQLAKLTADPEVSKILAELVAMSPEGAAKWLHEHLDAIERGLAS
jgi:hypothetical protein